MKILHVEFTNTWSWGLTVRALEIALSHHIWQHIEANGKITAKADADVILAQQITLMRNIEEKGKTICRLGGNRTFDEDKPMAFDDQMKQVFAIIATNKRLYEIGKKLNPNTFLIPNGLDLSEWSRVDGDVKPFTVGFAGNIQAAPYREYKGYDFVEAACQTLKVPLKTALYGQEQIPHTEMRWKFYAAISALVHPTKGEGCSNVIMEALACGVPVITTKVAGYHGEMLEDGKNVLFCDRTAESIEKCLRRLRTNKKLRLKLAENGRKFAEKHHDIRQIGIEFDRVFQSCYVANRKAVVKEVKETKKSESRKEVCVIVKEPIQANGNRCRGDIIFLPAERVRELGSAVEVINI